MHNQQPQELKPLNITKPQPASLPVSSAAFAELSSALLLAGKSLRFRATGNSMHPLIRSGDVLLVEPANPARLRPGDVVLFSLQPGQIIVHRIIQRGKPPLNQGFLIQGDQARASDGWVPEAQIYGRVRAFEREGRLFSLGAPAVCCLNRLAVWRTRWHLDRRWLTRTGGKLIKHLPILRKYFQ